ncbi:hypothetical protein B0I35DRAFT_464738 [Stachybotrys elegans]|uniref:Uncharacterized protein n=1 Tax=Stachybotrys elegans TaxID=80388 RepID=A0A8K0SDX2_9HYPO|nr:hypothetical protein B0I35DRAFT_464738 [Stachybotrys elegans]
MACRLRLVTVLVCLLGLAFLPSTQCLDTARQKDVPIAIGFHLGQSYATSVAHFSNGTVINLAKVPARDEYTALMERLIREPTPKDRSRLRESVWEVIMKPFRIYSDRDVAVLVRMTALLKAQSEAALGGLPIHWAAVTVPWMAAWDGQASYGSTINQVLVLVGMEPVSWEASYPSYLGDTSSLLASDKRWACQEHWCLDDRLMGGFGKIAFLISFTNHSLYTSFQDSTCFFYYSWHNRLVLVAGEAATEPGFVEVVREVVKSIPIVWATSDTEDVQIQEGTGQPPEVELLISEDPTFAGARGAAFWMWT